MWLLEASVAKAIEAAIIAGAAPSVEDQAKYTAAQYAESDDFIGGRILTVAGNQADIKIRGMLTPTPNLMAMIFGGGNTTYPEIVSALAEADRNPDVESVTLSIDSPGGAFDGLFDSLAAISSFKKPLKAVVTNKAASAAYAIASQADEIIAVNNATRFGSIGVAAEFSVFDEQVIVTSTNAPKKRPDVRTEEGKAVVREELDALHEIFVDAIASGRSVSAEQINADFGQGATLLAKDALSRGMIDSIRAPEIRAVDRAFGSSANSGGITSEANNMDLSTLRAQHPDVFAAAVQEGVNQERDRVTAHLTMGESSGDMKTASEAIKAGSGMTATLQATYMTAGMNRRDMQNRDADDVTAAAAANGADDTTDVDEGETVASLIEAKFGMEA